MQSAPQIQITQHGSRNTEVIMQNDGTDKLSTSLEIDSLHPQFFNEFNKQEGLVESNVANNHTITSEQNFNEAVIKLLVLLYQIDGKVTLTEQDFFDEITTSLNWHSGVSLSAFVTNAIHQARVAIDQRQAREFLFGLSAGLNHNPAQALEYAMDITEVDGKRSEEEIELLAILSNRILARGLVE